MMQRIFSLLIFLILVISFTARGQVSSGGIRPGTFGNTSSNPSSFTGGVGKGNGSIIDDSTKQIYGPRTTRYFLETDLFNNRKKLYLIDTLLDNVQRYNYVQRFDNRYQDLGNLGTALRPVFYEPPTQIGAQTGYYVYSPYAYQIDQVKYFNTRSPFTRMYVALGGRNQNILNFDFSQNVNPRLNIGFNLQRLTSQKQFGTSGTNSLQRFLVQSWAFLGHTNYHSKNEKYSLLVHFNHLNHQTPDQGAVLNTSSGDTNSTVVPFNYEGPAKLNGAYTHELHNDWHIYQQYAMEQGFQVYHRLDYQRRINDFADDAMAESQTYFDFYRQNARFDAARTRQTVKFRSLDNSFGIKGIYRGFNYRAYVRQRIYSQNSQFNLAADSTNTSDIKGRDGTYNSSSLENYLGGWLGYYFPDSSSRVTAELEYLIGGGYRLQGQLESRFLTAGYTSILAAPTLLQRHFESNIYNWTNNNFGLRGTQHAYGQLNLKVKNLTLRPGLDYYLLTNYVYFDTTAAPKQVSGAFSILRTGLDYTFRVGKFQVSGQGYYALSSRSDVIRQPKIFLNTRIQYEFLYAKVLYIQTGLDLHYKSGYYADAYMPLTQQFYLQNQQKAEGYLLADVFANLRINRTRLFVKMAHVNQGLLGPAGYYTTPGFLGMRRSFGFGVDWYLFD